ncbi:hypothetical protein HID58_032038, partial [Brassica napus]
YKIHQIKFSVGQEEEEEEEKWEEERGIQRTLVPSIFHALIDSYHRTVVTSSLVHGVYLLQREKQKKVNLQAYIWWESFGFSLAELLVNEDDSSIYGAVFKYNNYQNKPHFGMPPLYMIAFRGTVLKSKTWLSDLKEDIRCLFNNLNKGSRFQQAIKAIETVLETTETSSVWLAGHSLGAGIALMVGKTMTKRGFPLKTYAFSPPILSFPLEKLPDIDVTQEHDPRIAAWTPYLYVNPSDTICSESIGLLKYKKIMAYVGLGKFESLGAAISLRCLVLGVESGEPIQLLSSADMTVNMNKSDVETTNVLKRPWYKLKRAHGLEQWWEPNPALRANWESHNFRPSEPRMD